MTTTLESPPVGALDTSGFSPPRYRYVPDTKVGDFGDEIVDMMGLFGRELDAEQRQDVADLSSYDARGRWVSLESGHKEARQNGKTGGVLLPVTVFDLFELPPDRICWTAHRFRTARGVFDDLMGSDESPSLLDRAPEYLRRIRRVNRTHGEEGIYLKNGASLEFLAREYAGTGRGLGGKRNILDEALILKGALIGGLIPTLSARSGTGLGPSVNYASSAALAGPESDHLRTLTRRGRYAKPGDRFLWIERCAPGGWGTNPCDLKDECPHDGRLGCQYPLCRLGRDCPHTLTSPGCALDNLEYVRMANHTLGRRISVQYVLDERQSMADLPREYGRERLGWDEEPPKVDAAGGVDIAKLDSLANTHLLAPAAYNQAAVVVDMPPGRSEHTIAVAWIAEDPVTQARKPAVMLHVLKDRTPEQVCDYLAGTENDPDGPYTAGLLTRIDLLELAVQAGGPAGSLIKPLDQRGQEAWPSFTVRGLTGQECAQAVGHWLDSVKHGTFWHLGQQELHDAQVAATLRKYGDALMWERRDLSNISPLVAATLALHRLFTEGDGGGPNLY